MAQYKIELKPVKMIGVENLSADKKQMFDISLVALAQFMRMIEGVQKVDVQEDYSIFLEGDDSIEEHLDRIKEKAFVTKIQ